MPAVPGLVSPSTTSVSPRPRWNSSRARLGMTTCPRSPSCTTPKTCLPLGGGGRLSCAKWSRSSRETPYSAASASLWRISGVVSPDSHFARACRVTPTASAAFSWESPFACRRLERLCARLLFFILFCPFLLDYPPLYTDHTAFQPTCADKSCSFLLRPLRATCPDNFRFFADTTPDRMLRRK